MRRENDLRRIKREASGVILETDSNIWKIQKRALFQYNKVKKGTPYVRSLFTIVLIKPIFEKNKSLRAASRGLTQF